MHYCEDPFDVLEYYPLVNNNGELSEFAEVDPLGEIYKKGNKCATDKLHIKTKLGLKGFIKACIDFTLEKTKIENVDFNVENNSSGDYAKITSEGKNSVVMAVGYNSIAKAKIGSWITLSEWENTKKRDEKNNYIWIPKCVKTEYVDGERIKEDVFYKLVDGEFREENEWL